MGLYDGRTERQKAEKREKMKKIILVSIIIVCLLIFVIIGLIMYISGQPSAVSIKIDGKTNNELLKLITIKTDESGAIKLDEDGNPIIYAPIKKVAKYFGYDDSNGNYMTVSEDINSCNVKNVNEVSIFTLDSNVIYKKDLTNEESNYETYKIDEEVFQSENELYTNKDGLEIAFNIYIYYNSKTNSIDIYTLDYYVSYYTTEDTITQTTPIQDLGYGGLDEVFVNQKAILDGMIVVKDETGTYGVIDSNGDKVFSTQYDSLTYIPESKSFLIQSDGKYGIMSVGEENNMTPETKIKPVYSSLQLIDNEKQLYLVSENNKFGVIDINSNIIVPLDYTKIGVDITQFAENNITNGYIIQDTLIPVQQDQKWGFYDLNGKIVGEGIVYETVGSVTTSSIGTAYNVLSIPEFKSIVVSKSNKYGCIGLNGEQTVAFIADDVYMQISAGETKYIMSQTKNEQIYTKDIAELIK